jgi:hypothetical protein
MSGALYLGEEEEVGERCEDVIGRKLG